MDAAVDDLFSKEEKFNVEDFIFQQNSNVDFTLEEIKALSNTSRRSKRNAADVEIKVNEKGRDETPVITKQLRTRTIYARVDSLDLDRRSSEEEEYEDDDTYEIRSKRKTTVAKLTLETEEFEQVYVKRKRYRRSTFLPRNRDSLTGVNRLPWTLAGLSLHMSDNRAALEFCQEKKLLPESKLCPVCHEQMLFSEKLSSDKGLGFVFRCSRRACQIVRSARSGTWFEKSKLPIRKSLLLTYCFATNFPFSLAVHESSFTAGCTSPTTVSDWYSYCREVCMDAMSRQMAQKVGGEHSIVEMDEIIIGEKLLKKRSAEGQAILGFYCRNSDRVSIARVPRNRRDGSVLIPIIEDYVNPGSLIQVTCWNPEEVLGPGYHHLVNNCRIIFSGPGNGVRNAHIEKFWRLAKSYVPQIENGKKPDQLYDYLCEFLWRRWVDMNKRDPFEAFLDDAAVLYTLPNDDDDSL